MVFNKGPGRTGSLQIPQAWKSGSIGCMGRSVKNMLIRSSCGEYWVIARAIYKRTKADWSSTSCFTAESPKHIAANLENFVDFILKPFPAQVLRRNEVPRRALVYVLSQASAWSLSDKAVSSIAKAEKPEDFDLRLNLPTDGKTMSLFYVF